MIYTEDFSKPGNYLLRVSVSYTGYINYSYEDFEVEIKPNPCLSADITILEEVLPSTNITYTVKDDALLYKIN